MSKDFQNLKGAFTLIVSEFHNVVGGYKGTDDNLILPEAQKHHIFYLLWSQWNKLPVYLGDTYSFQCTQLMLCTGWNRRLMASVNCASFATIACPLQG